MAFELVVSVVDGGGNVVYTGRELESGVVYAGGGVVGVSPRDVGRDRMVTQVRRCL